MHEALPQYCTCIASLPRARSLATANAGRDTRPASKPSTVSEVLRRLALAFAGVLLGATVLVVWIVPSVFGPFSVECGELNPETCNRVWRTVAAENGNWLPVTAVRVIEAGGDSWECGSYYIERWIFANAMIYDCL